MTGRTSGKIAFVHQNNPMAVVRHMTPIFWSQVQDASGFQCNKCVGGQIGRPCFGDRGNAAFLWAAEIGRNLINVISPPIEKALQASTIESDVPSSSSR
jgi:hypothetical protein